MSSATELAGEHRDETLTRLAIAMRRFGCCEKTISTALADENARRCTPPLPEAIVTSIAVRAAKHAPVPDRPEELQPRPRLAPAALYGLAGRVVGTILSHVESGAASLLVHLLVAVGSVLGRGVHFRVGADVHRVNLFAAIVGETGSGSKGSALNAIMPLIQQIDETWSTQCVVPGVSTGEGLIAAVARRGRSDGTGDPRLLQLESELGSTFRRMAREGSILSQQLRQAWEDSEMGVVTKADELRAPPSHISLIGHITPQELLHLQRNEKYSGLANRFLWAWAERSKCLPSGGRLAEVDMSDLVSQLERSIRFGTKEMELRRSKQAEQLWEEVHERLARHRPGILGLATSRARPIVMRLACIYAVLDRSRIIKRVHLKAALAVWKYGFESARYLFGHDLGDPVLNKIYEELRFHPRGMSRTELRDLFGRNLTTGRLAFALKTMEESGLAFAMRDPTDGRPAEKWFATK